MGVACWIFTAPAFLGGRDRWQRPKHEVAVTYYVCMKVDIRVCILRPPILDSRSIVPSWAYVVNANLMMRAM